MLKSTMQTLKMRRIFVSVILSGLFVLPLLAQDRFDHVTVGAGAGFSFPLDALSHHTKTGFNFVASGGPRFDRLSLTLDFSLHYLDVKNSLESQDNLKVSLGSMMRLWTLTVNPRFEFLRQERFSAYATGGYGLYNRRLLLAAPGPVPVVVCDDFWDVCVRSSPVSSEIVSGDLGLYKGGYNAGGGVTFGTRTKFFAEVRYHHMFTSEVPTQVIPLSFGIRW
jgi:hypothetical protein